MDSIALLVSLAVVDFAAAATPGANFVLVTETALSRTRRHALAVVAGFVVSNLIWCCAVVAGLAALFALSPWLYAALRVIGGAYLIYLGISLWLRRNSSEVHLQPGSFWRGMLTNLSNPKSVIYFGSIFAAFLGPGTPVGVHVAAIAIVLFNTVLWYGIVALTFSSAVVQRRYTKMRGIIDRVAGSLMVVFGLRLVLADDE